MPKFKIAWDEMYCFEAEVEAESLEQAIEKVKDDPSIYAATAFEGQYVDGSMEINMGHTEWLNSEANDANRIHPTPETPS